jgi:hypothetical protein
MKNILVVLLFTLALPFAAKGQILITLLFGDKLNSDGVEFGLSLGENFSNLSGVEESGTASSFNLGMFFNIKLKENIWFHPEILLKSSYGADGILPYSVGNSDLDNIQSQSVVERRLEYINIPLLMKYRTDGGFGIEAGPQLSILRKGKDTFKSTINQDDDLKFDNDIKDGLSSMDFGVAFGISQKLQKRKGITLNLRYYYGLTDLLKDNVGEAVKNTGLLLSAHIMIGKTDTPVEDQ